MKAFILAAGLGTRLRPWTLTHPKALVPVQGVPMLERVIRRLVQAGFDDITINVHHFADQVEQFLATHDFGVTITISDERAKLLDTGGALRHASAQLCADPAPVLVHNVDILSNAPLDLLMRRHIDSGASATLLTSERESSRRLVFDSSGQLRGWHNLTDGAVRPDGFELLPQYSQEAFSGIHIISPSLIAEMGDWPEKFSIIDFYLHQAASGSRILHDCHTELHLIDIGKPHTLAEAENAQGLL